MIFLGSFKAADTVKYRANFHNDTGTLENPTSPEAQIEKPDASFTALTTPAIINSKTGHYGGSIDTTGFAVGQHIIRMAGTVATAKTVATEFCFMIVANIESDTYAKVDTEIADIQSRIPAALVSGKIDSNMGSITNYVITNLAYSAGAIDAAAIAADVTTELTAGIRIKKNTALANFMFLMVDSTDHVTPKTGLTITATMSIDGAAFASCANSATEVANGMYKINLAATDLNGDVITLRFTGTAADARLITIVTTT